MKLIDKLTFYKTENLYIGRLYMIHDIKAKTIWGRDPANDKTTISLKKTPLNKFVAAHLVQEPNYPKDNCYCDIITKENYAQRKAIFSYHYDYYKEHYSLMFAPIMTCSELHQDSISKEKLKKLIKNVEQKAMENEKQHRD